MPQTFYSSAQNFRVNAPAEGEVFKDVTDPTRVFKRVGFDIYSAPVFSGLNYASLPDYRKSDFGSSLRLRGGREDVSLPEGTSPQSFFAPTGSISAPQITTEDPQLAARLGAARQAGAPLAQYRGTEGLNPFRQTLPRLQSRQLDFDISNFDPSRARILYPQPSEAQKQFSLRKSLAERFARERRGLTKGETVVITPSPEDFAKADQLLKNPTSELVGKDIRQALAEGIARTKQGLTKGELVYINPTQEDFAEADRRIRANPRSIFEQFTPISEGLIPLGQQLGRRGFGFPTEKGAGNLDIIRDPVTGKQYSRDLSVPGSTYAPFENIDRMPVIDAKLPPGQFSNMPVEGYQGPRLPPGYYPTGGATPKVGDPIPGTDLFYDEADIANLQSGPSIMDLAGSAIAKMYDKGFVVNPNVQITPERIAEFLKIAETEIEPGFRTQLQVGREQFLRQLGYNTQEILAREQQLERKYGQAVKTLGAESAERGFALSGLRQQQERELATETQQQLEQGRRTFGFQAGTLGREYAGKFGGLFGQGLPQTPIISEAPTALAGETAFAKTGRELPLYQLPEETYNALVGSAEQERRTGIRSLGQFYEEQERQRRTLPL